MLSLYRNQQVREIEAAVYASQIDSPQGLMEKAGRAGLATLLKYWPEAQHILVYCGKGNNAGDGYVLARLAKQQGLKVQVHSIVPITALSGLALEMAKACIAAGVSILDKANAIDTDVDVIVDALLGSGLRGEIDEPFKSTIEAINHSQIPVLALDVPSGIDVDTGNAHGSAVKAQVTITFIVYKQGLFTYQALAHCGRVVCDDLQIPPKFIAKLNSSSQLMDWDDYKFYFQRRSPDAHKGNYGHVLIIGGDYGMGGAVRMAAEAALRVGAGLVSVATRPEHVTIVNCSRPEIMCHRVADPNEINSLLTRANAVVIGPGLGQTDWAKGLLDHVLATKLPLVLDADALNLLSVHPRHSKHWVLTPHPGEAARLLKTMTNVIQQDRFQAVHQLQQQYGGAAALKGAGTLIKSYEQPKICPAGNPGMASGGMGDILSGIIGGLIAQGIELSKAAEIGVLIHSMAADRAAVAGGERGLLATDILNFLRDLVNP